MKPVYLDYSATPPMDPRVFEAMRPYFLTDVGNAGSRTHVYGQKAKNAVDRPADRLQRCLVPGLRKSSSRAARPRAITLPCSA